MSSRRTIIYTLISVVLVLCSCVVIPCGTWVLYGPVNYFGCGTSRPDDITHADLVGTYTTEDGARLELLEDGTLRSSDLYDYDIYNERILLSRQGRWQLMAPSDPDDIQLVLGTYGTYLEISGTRAKPWLYWYEGDPDSCQLYRFLRT